VIGYWTPTQPSLFDPEAEVVLVRGHAAKPLGPASNGWWRFRSLGSGITLTEYPEAVTS
jgi:hypothetical protein